MASNRQWGGHLGSNKILAPQLVRPQPGSDWSCAGKPAPHRTQASPLSVRYPSPATKCIEH
eukprot:4150700-Amphidinium_carterae.1